MLRKHILLIVCLISFGRAFPQEIEPPELNSIEFKGNEEISSSVLSSVIYSQETPWWFWKFLNSFTPLGSEAVYFDSSDLELDIYSLEQYYNANGFFNASFSYEYEYDTSANSVDLTFNIAENEFCRYGKINLVGLDSVPYGIYEDLETDMTMDSTKRYMQSEVQANINNFVNILMNSGYAFASFDSTVVFIDTTERYADLDIYFTPENLYHIDSVIVNLDGEGADEVSGEALTRITGLEKGEPYSLAEMRQGQSRLFRTGLFSSINLHVDDSARGRIDIPIILDGTIMPLNELSPEIIVNDQQNALNLGLGTTYIRRNFLGSARRLTARASFGVQDVFNIDYGTLIKKFSFRDTTFQGYVDSRISIEQPYLFNEPIHGILDNYITIEKQRNYNLTRYGSKITFDFELPHYTIVSFFNTSYNIEQTNEYYFRNRDSLSKKLLSIIGFNVGRSTADNILYPTEGYSVSLLAEEANSLPYLISKIAGSSYSGALFYRLVLNSSYYLALDPQRNLVFAAKFKGGHMQPYYGDYSGLPISRTFYAGGGNSIRGWQSNELVPQGTPEIEGFRGLNVKGGTFLLEGSTELRYRTGDFGTAIFVDYGNVWLDYTDFTFPGTALAAGFGIRYYTQVAPFRIDFGFKLYDPGKRRFIWDNWDPHFFENITFHFGIGEAF